MQLEEYLGLKKKLEIKKEGDREFYASAVQQVNKDSIYIDIPFLARRSLILPKNSRIMVCFISEEGVYEFESKVLGYSHGTVPFYEISRPEKLTIGQRRALFRLDVTLDVECWPEVSPSFPRSGDKKTPKIMKAKTIDISGSGVKISSYESFNKGQDVILILKFEDMESQKLPAKVIWTTKEIREGYPPLYYAGLKFTNISRKVQDNLIGYLFKVQARRRLSDKTGE